PMQGKTILELRALQVAAVTGGAPLIAPLDLIVPSGERIGVVGPNGIGKTTLLRAILSAAAMTKRGDRGVAEGVVAGSGVVGKNTKVAYLDQARETLDDDKSIFDGVRGEGGGTQVNLGIRGMESMDLRSYLEMFLFDPHKQRQKVGSLSGGERAHVALAKVLREGANLLVFDEPTNDLDLPTLSALEEMLTNYDGSCIVVTHDRAFLDRTATAILAFEPDPNGGPAKITRYAGGYEDYIAQRGKRRSVPPPTAAGPPPIEAAVKRAPKAKSELTYAERLELETIVDAVEAADARVGEIESRLADPSLYAKRGAPAQDSVVRLQEQLVAAKTEAARLAKRWELLEAKKS